MKTERHLQRQLESLFARCPDLWGFSVREEAQELYVSDIGISPRLSAEQYGEIYEDIAETIGELLEEEPRGEWLKGRTSRARCTNLSRCLGVRMGCFRDSPIGLFTTGL